MFRKYTYLNIVLVHIVANSRKFRFQYLGSPETVAADLGNECIGAEFQERWGRQGISVQYTDAKAPWQNGCIARQLRIAV